MVIITALSEYREQDGWQSISPRAGDPRDGAIRGQAEVVGVSTRAWLAVAC